MGDMSQSARRPAPAGRRPAAAHNAAHGAAQAMALGLVANLLVVLERNPGDARQSAGG